MNYTVVVDASNESGKLLPGMTATVDFVIDEKKDVLLVPNSAIQFKPDQAMLDKVMKKFREEMAARHPEGGERRPARDRGARGRPAGRCERGAGEGRSALSGGRGRRRTAPAPSRVFYMDENGEPAIAFFMPGATDGRNTEVKESRVLVEGMQVITGDHEGGQDGEDRRDPLRHADSSAREQGRAPGRILKGRDEWLSSN